MRTQAIVVALLLAALLLGACPAGPSEGSMALARTRAEHWAREIESLRGVQSDLGARLTGVPPPGESAEARVRAARLRAEVSVTGNRQLLADVARAARQVPGAVATTRDPAEASRLLSSETTRIDQALREARVQLASLERQVITMEGRKLAGN